MSEQPGAGRLDAETLAAYVDGRLPPEERARVEAEMAADPDSYEWLVNTMQAVGAEEVPTEVPGREPPGRVTPFFRRRGFLVAAGGALAAAAALVLVVQLQPSWWQRLRGDAVDPRMAKLVAAVGEERYIEGRLTGGFKYGPLRSVTRGPGDLSKQNLALLAAAGELQKAAQADPSAENLHAWGVAQLSVGQLDEAARNLQNAVRERADARWLSDLAAAHLALAAAGRSEHLPMAMDAAERASLADPGLLEARFNRALSIQRLRLREAAIAAWEEYLRQDRDSRWRGEAERHLLDARALPSSQLWQQLAPLLGASIVDEIPERFRSALSGVRAYLETDVLQGWASGQGLSTGARLARALERSTGDRFHVDVLQAFETTPNAAEASRALGLYLAAVPDFEANRFGAAAAPLADAARRFGDLGIPLGLMAELHLAACEYYATRYQEADARLERLHRVAVSRRYLNLEARSTWMRALVAFSSGRLGDTGELYQATLDTFERMNDPEQVSRAHTLLGTFHQYIGNGHRATLHRVLALESPQRGLRDQYNTVGAAAAGFANLGYEATGLALQRQVVIIADSLDDAALRAEARARLARMAASMGSDAEAVQQAEEARAALERVADDSARDRMRVRVLAARADAWLKRDPGLAADSARQALEIVSQRRDTLQMAQLSALAARAYLAAGNVAAADETLQAGLQAFESERASLERAGRIGYTDEVWTLFDVAVRLAAERGDRAGVLAASERARGRAILEDRGVPAAPPVLQDIQAALDVGEGVLLIHQLDDALWLQVIRSNGDALRRTGLTREAAERLVARLESDVAAGAVTSSAGRALFDALIGPVRPDLDGVTSLVVVPDAPYHSVPFASLEGPGGRVLVDDRAVSLSPSLALWTSPSRLRSTPVARESVLSIGPPTVMPDDLPALPLAGSEVEAVSRLYPRSVVLASSAEAFLKLASRFDAIHIATHSVPNPGIATLARLVMDSPVYARDIETVDLRHGPLIVLAACQSMGAMASRGEGPMGLARSFLSAGASAVVATLRDLEDGASAGMFVAFHQEYRAGASPAESLRRAMLAARERDPRMASWSGVAVIGVRGAQSSRSR